LSEEEKKGYISYNKMLLTVEESHPRILKDGKLQKVPLMTQTGRFGKI
jgi:hypothetical protein